MCFSLIPGNELSWFSKLWKIDKVVHFTEYMGVGFLMINMLMVQQMNKNNWQFALLFLLLFPLFDELLQYYIPYRIPDIYDAIADVCGGLTGAYIKYIMRH